MITHALFPTLVSEFHNPNHEQFKKTFFERFHLHCNEEGRSNEGTAHNDIHQDIHFRPTFDFIFQCLKEHIKEVGMDPEFQQLYLVKCWLMITKKWHVPVHNHADAHISFVYYVNLPTDFVPDNLCFLSPRPNAYYEKIYNFNALKWNQWNCTNFSFPPKEGMLLFFPGKLEHFTGTGNENHYDPNIKDDFSIRTVNQKRICMAGDFIFTYKSVVGKSFGLMPVENWLKAN